jgi:hypothetical protein
MALLAVEEEPHVNGGGLLEAPLIDEFEQRVGLGLVSDLEHDEEVVDDG